MQYGALGAEMSSLVQALFPWSHLTGVKRERERCSTEKLTCKKEPSTVAHTLTPALAGKQKTPRLLRATVRKGQKSWKSSRQNSRTAVWKP